MSASRPPRKKAFREKPVKRGQDKPSRQPLGNASSSGARPGKTLSDEIRAQLELAGARRGRVHGVDIRPMLAETGAEPFSHPDWFFELKYDGYRLLAGVENGQPHLHFRRGRDASRFFPEIEAALVRLPSASLVLDGEVVVLDNEGLASFQRLQKRSQLLRTKDILRASGELPATLFAFDLLAWEGFDLRPLPLRLRKSILRRLLPRAGPLRFSDHVEGGGKELFQEIRRRGLEGVVAKKADSPYLSGRSPNWLKLCVDKRADFVVVGFTLPERSRPGFGALHVASYRNGALAYSGRVGTGFSDRDLNELRALLESDRRESPPCIGSPPTGERNVWVEPKHVCEVRFKQWTEEDLLRLPVFLRMRDDKRPEECVAVGPEPGGDAAKSPPQARRKTSPEPGRKTSSPVGASDRRIALTRLDKVFWPGEGHTKGDLIQFYRSVSQWLLPYLRDRPVVLTRYPDGISGKSFFQKDAPDFVPGWIRTERMWSDEGREISQFVCEDEDSLVYLVNLGTIPLHVWSSRVRTLDHPDWCILDLDPKEAPFRHVIRVAQAIHSLCDEIDLPSFVKTSGSAGLHVLIPLGRQCTHAQSTALAQLVARVIAEELPEIATVVRVIADRGKRVYLDYLQNGNGKLLASPYCVRPLPGAPVSTPLQWDEVRSGLRPRQFHIGNVAERMQTLSDDPMRPVLDLVPDLSRALDRLSERLKKS